MDFTRELKKTMEPDSDSDTHCSLCSGNCDQRLGKKIGGIGNQGNNRHHPNHSIVEIGYNTEESP